MGFKKILVTGAAGFIGARVAEIALAAGIDVVGIDNVNDYYDVNVKRHRLQLLHSFEKFVFYKDDIEDLEAMRNIIREERPDVILNLAARAGVRYSIENPYIYFTTNSNGNLNLLECCREFGIKKYLLASTSSLYAGQKMPFSPDLPVNEPISPYAASKKAAEVTCYTYNYLFDINVSVVRFFTVYGPAGRPDMSVFRFIKWIDEGVPIELFGDGTQSRDFTYVDDIARGTLLAADKAEGYRIFNLGGNKPYELNYMINLIEKELGKTAKREEKPFHKADMMATWADTDKSKDILGWEAAISLDDGIAECVKWYTDNLHWLKNVIV